MILRLHTIDDNASDASGLNEFADEVAQVLEVAQVFLVAKDKVLFVRALSTEKVEEGVPLSMVGDVHGHIGLSICSCSNLRHHWRQLLASV